MARAVPRLDKDTNATLDYQFDWSAQMDADTDSITSATVSAPSGIGLSSATVTGSTVSVFISGGTEGTTYAVVNHVWTTGGRQDDKVLEITAIQQPSATQTIVVETGQQGTTSNAYSSVTAADSYAANHLYSSSWTQAETATKEKALIMSTRLLDEWFSWHGTKASDTQALQWPRHGTVDRGGWSIDSDELPTELVNATAEMARQLIDEDRTNFKESSPRGYKSIKAGSLEMEFDSASRADVKDVVPQAVITMLAPYGTYVGATGVVALVRA